MSNDDSQIVFDKDGQATMFCGPDAVAVYRAATLASSLRLWAGTGLIPTRGVTITRMLELATEITRKPYKRGDALKAAADLSLWAQEAKAALPHVGPDGEVL